MSKSGGAARTVRSVRERASRGASGASSKPAGTLSKNGKRVGRPPMSAEQAHAEQVARAEEAVRKAQARVDAAARATDDYYAAHAGPRTQAGGRVSGFAPTIKEGHAATRALQSAKTRLEKLRAANPSLTPAQRAHAAKSAQYEAKIAKARDALAKLEAEYAAHRRGAGEAVAAAGPARGNSTPANRTRQQAPAGVSLIPRADSLLRAHLTDVTDPRAAWTTFGASRQRLYDTLKDESAGVLESMARRSGGRPPRLLTSNNDVSRAINRDRLARFISDQMAREFGS